MVNFYREPHISLSQELKQVQVLLREVEERYTVARDTQNMNPDKVLEHPPRGGVLDGSAFLVGQVASWSCRAVRMRDSPRPHTPANTVMTINRAMMRSGFLRESDEAKNCGSLRNRKPRSARAGPL